MKKLGLIVKQIFGTINSFLRNKKNIVIKYCAFLFLAFISCSDVAAQSSSKISNLVEKSFLQADFGQILPYFSERAEIILPNNSSNIVAKTQAKNVLNKFCEGKKMLKITRLNSEERSNLQYLTYLLNTEKDFFRIFVVLKNNLIIQIKITNENSDV
ncbi:MAG: DUF4783 domain-containing protein [Prevotellaceae bacterium]|jgi:hypothetical protein|nr:DUF4783 domain-containing protein [Prevotellaceae bacterium]